VLLFHTSSLLARFVVAVARIGFSPLARLNGFSIVVEKKETAFFEYLSERTFNTMNAPCNVASKFKIVVCLTM